jgi:hypothetical protein
MLLLTLDAKLICGHSGHVQNTAQQSLVTIEDRPVLVDNDPEGRPIKACPNYGALIKPCVRTLAVKHGYSDLIEIEGHRVCLDTIEGLTDGTPPGTVHYLVRSPGQDFVEEAK